MLVYNNLSLQKHHTFDLPVQAKTMVVLDQTEDFTQQNLSILLEKHPKFYILGEGSNTLFCTANFEDLVIKIANQGYQVISETTNNVIIRVAAGTNWSKFVDFCLEQNWYGLENLSLIPGTVGAAPVQNIGAYGKEIADYIVNIDVLDLQDNCRSHQLNALDCKFAYRDSIFKQYHQRFLIKNITLRLDKQAMPQYAYPDLQAYLDKQGICNPNHQQIATAIKAIRKSKLPDPEFIPNAGSFFKNPVIDLKQAKHIQQLLPEIKLFSVGTDQQYKVSAAYLIEAAQLKGYSHGGAQVYPLHALILINQQKAKGQDVLELVKIIQDKVAQCFNICLEVEPNLLC